MAITAKRFINQIDLSNVFKPYNLSYKNNYSGELYTPAQTIELNNYIVHFEGYGYEVFNKTTLASVAVGALPPQVAYWCVKRRLDSDSIIMVGTSDGVGRMLSAQVLSVYNNAVSIGNSYAITSDRSLHNLTVSPDNSKAVITFVTASNPYNAYALCVYSPTTNTVLTVGTILTVTTTDMAHSAFLGAAFYSNTSVRFYYITTGGLTYTKSCTLSGVSLISLSAYTQTDTAINVGNTVYYGFFQVSYTKAGPVQFIYNGDGTVTMLQGSDNYGSFYVYTISGTSVVYKGYLSLSSYAIIGQPVFKHNGQIYICGTSLRMADLSTISTNLVSGQSIDGVVGEFVSVTGVGLVKGTLNSMLKLYNGDFYKLIVNTDKQIQIASIYMGSNIYPLKNVSNTVPSTAFQIRINGTPLNMTVLSSTDSTGGATLLPNSPIILNAGDTLTVSWQEGTTWRPVDVNVFGLEEEI